METSVLIGTCIIGCVAWLLWFFSPKLKFLQTRSKQESPPKQLRIYVDGCWDLCHSGHYNALRQAKA